MKVAVLLTPKAKTSKTQLIAMCRATNLPMTMIQLGALARTIGETPKSILLSRLRGSLGRRMLLEF